MSPEFYSCSLHRTSVWCLIIKDFDKFLSFSSIPWITVWITYSTYLLEIYFFGNCAYYYMSCNYYVFIHILFSLYFLLCRSKNYTYIFPQFLCDMICSYVTSLDWADMYTYSKCSHKLFLHGILMFLALNFLWCRLLLFLQ